MPFGSTKKETTKIENKESKPPIFKIRAGAVSSSVWEHEAEKDGKKFTFYSVSPQKSYLDKNQKWQHTNSYKIQDIPALVFVLQQCWEKAIESEVAASKKETNEEEAQ